MEVFDTEQFFTRLAKNSNVGEEWRVIDRFCKKIDVVKRIYKHYTKDLSKKTSEVEINDETYGLILDLYCNRFSTDLKFLNTAFKINDICFDKKIIDEKGWSLNKKHLLENLNKIGVNNND